MICKYCGGEVPDISIYCMFCGERLARKRREKGPTRYPKARVLADGSLLGQVMLDGQRETVKAADEREYRAKIDALRAGLVAAKRSGPQVTLGQAIDRYIADREKVLSPATVRGYKEIRKQRFQSSMVCRLSDIQWQAVINEEAGEVSPKTIRNAWGLVRSAAAAQGVEPPAVRLPQKIKKERPWLDYEQIQSFLREINGRPGELAALLALHSLRRSELLALDKSDVDLKKLEIRVEAARVKGPDGMVTKDGAKTAAGRRVVPVMIGRLEELLKAAGEGPIITGNPNTSRKQINAACERAGLPLVGVHGLRHSFASLAYHLGWSEATTMQIGGWSDPGVVHGIYTHLAQGDKMRDVERMREYYRGDITTKLLTGDKKSADIKADKE
ncbi:MAG: site-specific integrase [Oscillospiraceae bacterium]|nr:site-specific integrase [Oscillospiraceae bacterium]